MLSYQHIFHAGNHADILKHCVLIQVLDSLNKKDKPYTFFDTHSGSGLYDLTDNRSLKTGEAEKGILRFCRPQSTATIPSSLQRYFDFISKYVNKSLYPGSPEIERSLMRRSDNLILSELHPQEIENLRENMKGREDTSATSNISTNFPSIQIHKRNGWEMLKALTPPATKRGAVLIDPSYEESQDYVDAADTIIAVNKKWSNGIIMLWYPLLEHRDDEIKSMLNRISEGAHLVNQNVEITDLRLEAFDKSEHKEVELKEFLAGDKKNPPRLYGSGMFIINSPWKIKEETEAAIDWLKNAF